MHRCFYLVEGQDIPQHGKTSIIIEAENEDAAKREVSSWRRVDSVQNLCVANDFSRSIEKFCRDVFNLEIIYDIYKELFEDTAAQQLMEQTAHVFFLDMMKVLHGYLLLEFAKITDKPKSRNHENFTVTNLIHSNRSMFAKNVFEKLCLLNKEINSFRKLIDSVRDKYLAHSDKNTRISEPTLGKFPEKEDDKFIHTLQEIASIMHEACFGSNLLGENPVVHGGVRDFKDALCDAVAFRKALLESNREGKPWLTEAKAWLLSMRNCP